MQPQRVSLMRAPEGPARPRHYNWSAWSRLRSEEGGRALGTR